MSKKVLDLILSDLHLGDLKCNRTNILKLINSEYENLIINGDLFSCYHTDNLDGLDYKILNILEDLQKENRCVLIGGNHELHINVKKYTTLKFVDNFVWERFETKIGAIHGHAHRISDYLLSTKDRALKFAKNNGCEIVFAGHNHCGEIKKVKVTKLNNITYVNTGAFVNWINYYGVINDNETFSLKRIPLPKTLFIGKNLIDSYL